MTNIKLPINFSLTANIDASELQELSAYTNSFYNVKQNVLARTGINYKEQSVTENGVEYKFYYIPIEATLKLVLTNEIAMDHILEWNQS